MANKDLKQVAAELKGIKVDATEAAGAVDKLAASLDKVAQRYRDPKTGRFVSAPGMNAPVMNITETDRIRQQFEAAGGFDTTKMGEADVTKQIEKLKAIGTAAGMSSATVRMLTNDFKAMAQDKSVNEMNDEFNRMTEAINNSTAAKQRAKSVEADRNQQMMAELEILKQQEKAQKSVTLTQEQFDVFGQDPRYAKAAANITKFVPPGVFPTVKVAEEQSSGIAKVTASYKGMNGILYQLNQTIGKHGEVLMDTQRRFRTFGDALGRDIVEVAKWSIAVALIYGPMKKLNELVQAATENQTRLADVLIAVGKTQEDVNAIFNAAADIADKMGESLTGVIEGYALAYRATGNIKDESERAATANQLMADSLILSKLSGMAQAEALDTLTASLRQLGMKLTEGTDLLDKWVKTTKSANVDLDTLSHGFGVVGDAAEAAGIDADKLNGILATVAETGVGTAMEVANATRALISGFQSEQAQKALAQYGIAAKTATGEMRPFLDIMKQISDLKIGKVLSDTDISRLTLILGGGTRRQAAYSAFIENFGRVNEVAQESAKAAGEAEDAMAIKLDTVKTSVTRLGNAFQGLAQNMGTKGGILDIIQAVNNALATLVKGISSLVGVLGKSAPMLGILAVILGYQGIKGGGLKISAQPVADLLTRINPAFYGAKTTEMRTLPQAQGGTKVEMTRAEVAQQRAGQLVQANWGLAAGIGTGAISAIQSLAGGEGKRAAGEFGGSIAGAVIGNLLLPGVGGAIGGMIGVSIGDAFINLLAEKKVKLEDIFKETIITPKTTGKITEAQQAVNAQAAYEQARKALYERPTTITKGMPWTPQMGEAGRKITPEEVSQYIAMLGKQITTERPTTEQEIIAKYIRSLIEKGKDQELADFIRLFTEPGAIPVSKEIENAAVEFTKQYGKILADIAQKQTESIMDQLATGKLTPSQANAALANVAGFQAKAAQWMPQIGGMLGGNQQQQLGMIANVATYAPEEIQTQLNQMITQAIEDRKSLIDAQKILEGSEHRSLDWWIAIGGVQQAIVDRTKDWNTRLQQAITLLLTVNKEIETAKQGAEVINFKNFSYADVTKMAGWATGQYQQQLQAQRDISTTDEFTQATMDAKMAKMVTVIIQDVTGKLTKLTLPEGALAILQAQLDEAQKQTGIMEKANVGFAPMDTTTAQWNQAMALYPAFMTKLTNKGYTPQIEQQIVKLSDSDVFSISLDFRIMQYLLGEIADNTKKQLEGVYNMPEGAAFWFPNTAIPYMQAGMQGRSGLTPNDGAIITNAINASSAGLSGENVVPPTNVVQNQEPWRKNIDKLFQSPMDKWATQTWATGTTGAAQSKDTSFYGLMVTAMQTAFAPLMNWLTGGQTKLPVPYGTTQRNTGAEVAQLFARRAEARASAINFKLTIHSATQLICDGRTLASIIKPYLSEDLLNANGTTGAVTLYKAI